MKGASMRQHESGLKKKGIWLVALKLLTAFIPVIALFFANFHFSTAFAERLADNIIAGKKSYTFSNYNDRKLDKKIVERQRPVPETLVLSSSTGMQISSETTGYRRQLNLCMTGGNFIDYIAILQLYEEQGRGFPKRVVLALNASNFLVAVRHGQYGYIFDDAIANFYNVNGLERLKLLSKQLADFVKENLMFRFLVSGQHNLYERKEASLTPERMGGINPDGHRDYSEMHDKTFLMAKKAAALLDAPRVDSFPEEPTRRFNDIRRFCEERDIELVLFLLPLAPDPEGEPRNANHGVFARDLESYVKKLSEGLIVHGTFLPYELGLTNEDFHDDESHMKQENLKRVWDYVR